MRRRVIAIVGSAIMAFGAMGFAHADDVNVADTLYVGSDGLWSESNGLDGLQRTETDNGDGTFTAADDHIAP